MYVARTIVSSAGFRQPDCNPGRLRLLSELFSGAARGGAGVLAVPAGFLSVHAEHEVAECVRQIGGMASRAGMACLGGIDVVGTAKTRGRDPDELVRQGRPPFFGFAAGRVEGTGAGKHLWRQTSITNLDADLVAGNGLPGAERLVRIAGKRLGVLICGELYSKHARAALAALAPDALIDLGHSGMGQGLIPAMRSLAVAAGRPVAHSQHVRANGGLHFVTAAGEQESLPSRECYSVQTDHL